MNERISEAERACPSRFFAMSSTNEACIHGILAVLLCKLTPMRARALASRISFASRFAWCVLLTAGGCKKAETHAAVETTQVSTDAKAASDPAPAASPAAPAASIAAQLATANAACGTKPLPDCPLQAWMKAHTNPAMAANDLEALSAAFETIATFAPAGYPNWISIANDGKRAAMTGEGVAAKAACRSCHSQYKARYKADLRGRKI
jgi:hypothetical protein